MKSQIWTVGMGVTSLCNMNCPFCYSQDQRKVDDLDVAIWISFIEKNASFIHAINYGTGENTLSKAWYLLIEFVREHLPDVRQALTTNGSLVKAIENSSRADVINACIDEIDVSIDFADPERHNRMRGFPGAFNMAVNTLAYCKDTNKRATIVILGQDEMLGRENLAQLFDLASRYDAFVRINLYRHVSDKSLFRSPDLSTVLNALDWIITNHTVVSISEPVFRSIYGIPADFHLHAPLSMRILPNGDVTPSTYLITDEWVAGNIRKNMSLADLARTPSFQRFGNVTLPQACKGCPYADTCQGGTRDRRFLTWGNLDLPDIYCPRREDGTFGTTRALTPKLLQDSKTVHSDYLPTLIFSPNNHAPHHDTA
jgi:radical SAM protein with 4Fe4S-binding SPASM domain